MTRTQRAREREGVSPLSVLCCGNSEKGQMPSGRGRAWYSDYRRAFRGLTDNPEGTTGPVEGPGSQIEAQS